MNRSANANDKAESEPTVSTHLPEFDAFSKAAVDVDLVPVYRRLVSDSLTPVSAFRKIDHGSCSCLFESVIGGERVGRYSFLAADPYMTLEAFEDRVIVKSEAGTETFVVEDPLVELEKRVCAVRAASFKDLPPFSSGAVGYAGYDVVRYTENLPNAPQDDRQLPDLSFAFYDQMVVFDHITKTIIVVAMAHLKSGTLQKAYRDACDRIDALVARLSSTESALAIEDISTTHDHKIDYVSNFGKQDFEHAVRKCVNYIGAGDIFQVVLSQRLEMPISAHPFEIYRTLRVVNPSPFMFYLKVPDAILVGSSPEVMVRVEGGQVTVRPLAGTRRRGATDAEDHALADELLADPKERAEHVMLVDLGRNDIGRVAQFRSVALSDTMTIERYSHVMHITSNVTGQLESSKNAFDALRACLPAGTVSGAPKVRAMEIIDELEPHRRGPYAGAVGYADFNGNMDTCIALRTLVVQKNRAYVQAGAGIVADSVPENEYQETLNKARGLLKAIAITEQRHVAQQTR